MSIKTDAMLTKYATEIEERSAFIDSVVANAQDANRDLTESEHEMLDGARKRIEECSRQVTTIGETRSASVDAMRRLDSVDREMDVTRRAKASEVEYRSAGSWVVDMYSAHLGNRDARERLDIFNRAAAHQRTDDNPGVVPDPIIGSVIDFIDASRPLVSTLGTSPVVSNLFYRPHVTQHTSVARQTDGTTTDVKEKVELASQKMLIERLQVEIETYGGYVNVSRQNIDFSSPQIFDIIVNDLAKEYAIVTEEVVADAIATTSATPIPYANDPSADELIGPFWAAVAAARAAVPTGGLFLAIAPDRLAAFGPLFAPYGVTNGQSPGFFASNFGNGPVGSISGVPVVMSTALDSGEAFVIATQTIELFEQRIGTLQVVEPSVLGVQVAYAGYFGTLIIDDDGIVPLEEST